MSVLDFCSSVSSNESRLREFFETYNCKEYMSYIDMLRQESPDIVLDAFPITRTKPARARANK